MKKSNVNLPLDYKTRVSVNWDHMALKHPSYQPGARNRFWHSPMIMHHYNKLISGVGREGLTKWLTDVVSQRSNEPLKLGVSVGCGLAHDEIKLLVDNVVEKFVLFDFSQVQIKRTQEIAKKSGVLDRITFRSDNAFEVINSETFDLVYWRAALHHMPCSYDATKWSRDVLVPGGIFCAVEFVGANHFQYSKKTLDFVENIRKILPGKYLCHPKNPKKRLQIRLLAPNLNAIMSRDPSEAADSEDILRSITEIFPGAIIRNLGGIVYVLVLQDIIYNFNEKNEYDRSMLQILCLLDQMSIPQENLMIAAIAIK